MHTQFICSRMQRTFIARARPAYARNAGGPGAAKLPSHARLVPPQDPKKPQARVSVTPSLPPRPLGRRPIRPSLLRLSPSSPYLHAVFLLVLLVLLVLLLLRRWYSLPSPARRHRYRSGNRRTRRRCDVHRACVFYVLGDLGRCVRAVGSVSHRVARQKI